MTEHNALRTRRRTRRVLQKCQRLSAKCGFLPVLSPPFVEVRRSNAAQSGRRLAEQRAHDRKQRCCCQCDGGFCIRYDRKQPRQHSFGAERISWDSNYVCVKTTEEGDDVFGSGWIEQQRTFTGHPHVLKRSGDSARLPVKIVII